MAFLGFALSLLDQGVTTNPLPVPNPTLSFETRAALIDTVFEQISAKTGVRLMTSPKTAEEVLILRIKDVPLSDLMTKIAEATCAEWQHEANGWRLIRSAKLERLQKDAHFEMEAEQVRQAQERSRQTLADQAEFDDSKAIAIGRQFENILSSIRSDPRSDGTPLVQQNASNSLPGNRLLMRAALLFDPKELARIEVGGREAFATDPHRSQRALPNGIGRFIADFLKERAFLDKYTPSVDMQTAARLYPTLRMALQNRNLKNRTPARFVIEARRFDTGLRLDLWVANSRGRILDKAFCSLGFIEPTTMLTTSNGASETAVKFSPLSQQFIDKIREQRKLPIEARRIKLEGELKQIALEPEKRDLAQLAATDLAFALSIAKSKNVVACPTQSHSSWCALRSAYFDYTTERYLREVSNPRLNTKFVELDSWIVIGPRDSHKSRQESIPRQPLGPFLRAAEKNEVVTLDDLASLSSVLQVNYLDTHLTAALGLICPNWGRNPANWNMVKLHAALGAQKRNAMLRGEVLTLGHLDPKVKQAIHDLVFGNSGGFNLTRPMSAVRPKDEDDDGERHWDEFLDQIPTELWPNGLPASLVLSLKTIQGYAISASGVNADGQRTGMETDTLGLARWIYSQQNPGVQSGFSGAQWSNFRASAKTYYHYRLLDQAEFGYMGRLEDTTKEFGPFDRPDRLPSEVWTRIQADVERIKNPPPSVGAQRKK